MAMFLGDLIAKIAPHSELSVTMFPPTPAFVPSRDIPDLEGKIVLVTGGNAGIGQETVKQLLLKNATVYLAARSEEKALEAMKQLKTETGKDAIFLKLDLGDLHSVRKAAEEFLGKESRLDVLINNAGVMVPPPEQLTAQGYDLQFGTNVLGHHFLTKLLVPALTKSFAVTGNPARVVHVSSTGHSISPPEGIDWATLKGGEARDAAMSAYYGFMLRGRLYGQSKLGNILLAKYWAREHPGLIVSCSNHPGAIGSNLARHTGSFGAAFYQLTAYPVTLGALTQLWGALVAPANAINGEYLVPWARIGKPMIPQADDLELQKKMIEYCDEELKGY